MPKLEILAWEETPLGVLCLRRRALLSRPGTVVTEVTLDGEHLMSSYTTASERALASLALAWHDGPEGDGVGLDVLVGGLGLGYTAAEVLADDRVARLQVVEFLPQVARWLTDGLIPLAAPLCADDRMTVVSDDVYARLLAPPQDQLHDLILIDVDHAPDAPLDTANGRFYTEPGLRAAREHLAPGGILSIWSAAENSDLVDTLGRVFGDVRIEGVAVVNDLIDEQYTDTLFMGRR